MEKAVKRSQARLHRSTSSNSTALLKFADDLPVKPCMSSRKTPNMWQEDMNSSWCPPITICPKKRESILLEDGFWRLAGGSILLESLLGAEAHCYRGGRGCQVSNNLLFMLSQSCATIEYWLCPFCLLLAMYIINWCLQAASQQKLLSTTQTWSTGQNRAKKQDAIVWRRTWPIGQSPVTAKPRMWSTD